MVFSNCANACPSTCKQFHHPEECVEDGCKAGCKCKDGQYRDDDDVCVDQCPCYVGEDAREIGYSMPGAVECEQWYSILRVYGCLFKNLNIMSEVHGNLNFINLIIALLMIAFK